VGTSTVRPANPHGRLKPITITRARLIPSWHMSIATCARRTVSATGRAVLVRPAVYPIGLRRAGNPRNRRPGGHCCDVESGLLERNVCLVTGR
jgi:hypothetical protein